jgi:hypothetical protein
MVYAFAGGVAAQEPGCGYAVSARHPYVHDDDVRLQGLREVDRLTAVGRLADNVNAGFGGEQHGEAGADKGLVIGDDDGDGH